MDVLFLLTGFLCACAVPLCDLAAFDGKSLAFYYIMAVFFTFVLAYVILSFYKYRMARLSFLKSQTLLSWETDEPAPAKKNLLPYILCCAFGLILGIALLFTDAGRWSIVLFSLAVAFISLGWVLMGQKRLKAKLQEIPGFLLSHMGLIQNGKARLFDGYTRGIKSMTRENHELILVILNRKTEETLRMIIPDGQADAVDAVIADVNAFMRENA